ncbi:hypothetical protein ACPOL_4472 [Acidisarcina polymorpha]|uniref:Uncharacterized protein n=1 Tax=Acidisarcina polymorpha TaxID=2211140 RepID=A0A2Z5G4I4_9BACT|nr:hypothetical protein ACPOL_4472 [Acidisarcina polymorpha]
MLPCSAIKTIGISSYLTAHIDSYVIWKLSRPANSIHRRSSKSPPAGRRLRGSPSANQTTKKRIQKLLT